VGIQNFGSPIKAFGDDKEGVSALGSQIVREIVIPELTKEVKPGYWEHYGYDVDAWVGRSNGRSDVAT